MKQEEKDRLVGKIAERLYDSDCNHILHLSWESLKKEFPSISSSYYRQARAVMPFIESNKTKHISSLTAAIEKMDKRNDWLESEITKLREVINEYKKGNGSKSS